MSPASKKPNQIPRWIIGCGDIGKRVAALYQSDSKRLKAIVSSEESVKACDNLAIDSYVINLDGGYTLDNLDFNQTDLFYFAPPTPFGAIDYRLNQFLTSLKTALPRRIVLISTTGVYGDSAGEWIDESTPVNPKVDRALRRLSSEQALQKWSKKTAREYMILRVAGIYAEDRLPLERLKRGLPVINAEAAGYTNRIHAEDLAQACKAAMECATANQIINISDGNPSTMTDYFNQVADFAGLARPPQISLKEAEQVLSSGMLSYMKESRRIKNDKMLSVLTFDLRYPDLKTTLKR